MLPAARSLARLAALLACAACANAGAPRRSALAPALALAGADSADASDSLAEGRRERVAASASPLSARVANDSEWQGRGVSRVEELFVGRFPGVQVLRTPGGLSIRIRGATSGVASGDPLFVIDGFPIQGGPDGLIDLNPSDVARIEILKDAGSIAEYGVRGANGVVLITTKRNR